MLTDKNAVQGVHDHTATSKHKMRPQSISEDTANADNHSKPKHKDSLGHLTQSAQTMNDNAQTAALLLSYGRHHHLFPI